MDAMRQAFLRDTGAKYRDIAHSADERASHNAHTHIHGLGQILSLNATKRGVIVSKSSTRAYSQGASSSTCVRIFHALLPIRDSCESTLCYVSGPSSRMYCESWFVPDGFRGGTME